jgi:uncharacterized membrane protein YkoI
VIRRIQHTVAAIAALGALALGGSALAGAAGTSNDRDRGARADEKPLTGTTATRVKEAALAKVPGGTVLRVETDAGGIYEAHVRKSDGTEVEVKVNKDFEVTAVEEHGARGPGRSGRHPDEKPLTGTTATKVKEATLAKVPGGTVLRVETDAGGIYEAHVRNSDGTEVEVKVNKSFEVTAVEERRHP